MTIVFFHPVILRDAHRRIFPFEKLESEGHEVIILDATTYYNIYQSTALDDYIIKRKVKCETKADFINFRENLGEKPIIFVTDNLYMKMSNEVLNILVKKQDRLLAASTRFTPGHYQYPKGIRKYFFKLIRFLDKYIPLHKFKFYYKNIKKIYVPNYFLGGTKFLTPLNTFLSVKKENRIFVHSDDLNYAFEPFAEIIDPEKKIGVFLDQMIPYFNGRNPDVNDIERNREYKITYYKNLIRTFEKLKLSLDLDEIVIALHPEARTIRGEIDLKYYPFKTFIGVSNELIRDSTIVFGHYSTAIGMAAFYKKPIILLTDKEIINHSERIKYIHSYSIELGINKLRIDSKSMQINKLNLIIDESIYNSYIRRFLKQNEYQGNAYYFAIEEIRRIESSNKI